MLKYFITLAIISTFLTNSAQQSFPEKCLGKWIGTMEMYYRNHQNNQVAIELTVSRTKDSTIFIWKTEYISEKMPMVKDYKMNVIDVEKGLYELDEGEGIVLKEYLLSNKLYSSFETSGYFLNSTYELVNDQLIFEITSGKKIQNDQDVNNISVDNLQRVVLTRISDD